MDLALLPTCLRAGIGEAVGIPSLVGLQEVKRGAEGWTSELAEKWTVVSYRDPERWRGNGVAFLTTEWQILKRKGLPQGCWFKMRHLTSQQDLWFGVAYVPPHFASAEVQGQITQLLRALPATTLPCMLSGDVNSPISWQSDDTSVLVQGDDIKGRVLVDALQAQGFSMVAPLEDQLRQPTSRPRKSEAQGRRIDWIACKHVETSRVTICTDSSKGLGTDHDALALSLRFAGRRKHLQRVRLGNRVVVQKPVVEGDLDQIKMEQLARICTRPPKGTCYQDDNATRALFQEARRTRDPNDWKRALRHRREAYHRWQANRVWNATQGDWKALRDCKPGMHVGWEAAFAEGVSPEDPHAVLHDHYSGLFAKGGPLPDIPDPRRPVTTLPRRSYVMHSAEVKLAKVWARTGLVWNCFGALLTWIMVLRRCWTGLTRFYILGTFPPAGMKPRWFSYLKSRDQ